MAQQTPGGGAAASLSYYWFVQNNPLYFASALFVLLGGPVRLRCPL